MIVSKDENVKSFAITEAGGLDTITVYYRDYTMGHGRITIVCWGKSWTSYWSAMGDRSIAEFFYYGGEEYLIGNLSNISRNSEIENDRGKMVIVENPKYTYLLKIVKAVKTAIGELGLENG